MREVTRDPLMPAGVAESLDMLIFEVIGMTTLALSSESAGELTLPQWRALVVVGRQDGVRVGTVAEAVGMSMPSASRLINRLEKRGLVTTMRGDLDRRVTIVQLTDPGRDLRARVLGYRRGLVEASIAAYSPRLPAGFSDGLAELAKAFEEYV